MLYTVVFLILLTAVAARADEVRLPYDGKTLNADWVIADEGRASDEIMVILHGTLGHKDMEIIETLQSFLAEIGRDSLAINYRSILMIGTVSSTAICHIRIVRTMLLTNSVYG